MKNLLALASWVVALGCLGAGTTSMMDDPPPTATIAPIGFTWDGSCGNYCGPNHTQWCTIRICPPDAVMCCGWIQCFSGGCTGEEACCKAGETCSNGLQTNPPSKPKCTPATNGPQ